MKRGKPLRRRSKSKALIDRADRALQDWYRFTYRNGKCEICGKHFNVMHHFFPKSSSNLLRFDEDNLIFICNGCHFKHHRLGDPTIHGTVLKIRGIAWYNRLVKKKRITVKTSAQQLETLIEKYKIWKT